MNARCHSWPFSMKVFDDAGSARANLLHEHRQVKLAIFHHVDAARDVDTSVGFHVQGLNLETRRVVRPCQATCRTTDSSKSLMPFQPICTPIQTRRNDDNFVTTVIPFRPRVRARRSANPLCARLVVETTERVLAGESPPVSYVKPPQHWVFGAHSIGQTW
jgi:hypothetical protein